MKKVLLAIVLLLSLALVGCNREERYTASGWAMWAVRVGDGGTELPQTPYLINVEEASCVFEEDILEGENRDTRYACFIVTVMEDLDNNPIERKFAVFVGWIQTFEQRWPISSGDSRLQAIRRSQLRDIDVVELE